MVWIIEKAGGSAFLSGYLSFSRNIKLVRDHFSATTIGELTLENDFLEGALTKAGLLSAKR